MSDIYNGRMIPLHIADKAIINCNKEIEKLQTENARLKAQVERLEAQIEYVDNLANRYALDDVRSQAQVERLTKAGDMMHIALNLADDVFDNHEKDEAQERWRAAKEGKQS
jgi:predicted RNase H-like nuclease (RuvC/YqgF family)